MCLCYSEQVETASVPSHENGHFSHESPTGWSHPEGLEIRFQRLFNGPGKWVYVILSKKQQDAHYFINLS